LGLFNKTKKMNSSDSLESFDTLIGSATKIEGRMVVNKSIRLDGTIEGSIESLNTLKSLWRLVIQAWFMVMSGPIGFL
jgi:cytoskeletal protein CcmA (bactofilin family)